MEAISTISFHDAQFVKNKITKDKYGRELTFEPQNVYSYFEKSDRHFVQVIEIFNLLEKINISKVEFPLKMKHEKLVAAKLLFFHNESRQKEVMKLFGIRNRPKDENMSDKRFKIIVKEMFRCVGLEFVQPVNAIRDNLSISIKNEKMQKFINRYKPKYAAYEDSKMEVMDDADYDVF